MTSPTSAKKRSHKREGTISHCCVKETRLSHPPTPIPAKSKAKELKPLGEVFQLQVHEALHMEATAMISIALCNFVNPVFGGLQELLFNIVTLCYLGGAGGTVRV